jgi:nicotinate phosphoribosyltransferase
MAHSYVTSFSSLDDVPSDEINGVNIKKEAIEIREKLGYTNTSEGELAAFISYGLFSPNNFVCLIDSYDTLRSGVLNFLCVAYALNKA